jgi:orotidine-5'-phosphate decarboxylase
MHEARTPASPQLIVALDLPSSADIPAILDPLATHVDYFKVGLELFTADGPRALAALKDAGKNIFLDLKLHDIPNTVARTVTAAARHHVQMLTVHAHGGRDMLEAAARAAAELGPEAPRLLAVTTLTSLGPEDLRQMGIARPLAEHTLAMGGLAVAAGIDGVVCSVHEAAAFRSRLGPAPLLVTPGIRPRRAAGTDDQKRPATPAAAVQAGADFLVVGRPIVQAEDPRAAALEILDEMQAARPG